VLFDAPVLVAVKDEFKDIEVWGNLFHLKQEERLTIQLCWLQKNLLKFARLADKLLIATDNDREGENIGFEIISVCRSGAGRVVYMSWPQHPHSTQNVARANIVPLRLRFSAVTQRYARFPMERMLLLTYLCLCSEIQNAFRQLSPPNQRASEACDVRSEVDLRIGWLVGWLLLHHFFAVQLLNEKLFPRRLCVHAVSNPSPAGPVPKYTQGQSHQLRFALVMLSSFFADGLAHQARANSRLSALSWTRWGCFCLRVFPPVFSHLNPILFRKPVLEAQPVYSRGFLAPRSRARARRSQDHVQLGPVTFYFSEPIKFLLTCFLGYVCSTRTFDYQFCVILCEMCVDDPVATVVSVRGQQRTKSRPVGLTTTEMQKLASRQFGLSPADTLEVAERLYQGGFLSYPRTETDIFPPSMDLAVLVQEQTQHPTWGAFAQRLLPPNGTPTPHNGRNTDEAHPPIHPTKCVAPTGLADDRQRKVYELVVRHFLACCATDAKGQETAVTIELGGETVRGMLVWLGCLLEAHVESVFYFLHLVLSQGVDGAGPWVFGCVSLRVVEQQEHSSVRGEPDLSALQNCGPLWSLFGLAGSC
jgi:hypothetical protein